MYQIDLAWMFVSQILKSAQTPPTLSGEYQSTSPVTNIDTSQYSRGLTFLTFEKHIFKFIEAVFKSCHVCTYPADSTALLDGNQLLLDTPE